jgi:NAD(P)H dehydrogenase (quinone)
MNVLIVFAHPEHQSFTGTMLQEAVETLEEVGHSVQVSDLYRKGFNPVPGRHDFLTAHSDSLFNYANEQSHAHQNQSFAKDLRMEQDKLNWADLVIFQFPLWWFGLPAILKGWVDRVFANGYAYGGGRWFGNGAFTGKKGMLVITAGGPETAYQSDGIQGPIQDILAPLERGIFLSVGISVLPAFVAYGASYSSDSQKELVLDRLRDHLQTLESKPTIAPPNPTDYDETLRRKPQ